MAKRNPMTLCDLVTTAYMKNMKLSRDENRPLRQTLHQRRLWKDLQVTFAQCNDEEFLARSFVLPKSFLHPEPARIASSSPLTKVEALPTLTDQQDSHHHPYQHQGQGQGQELQVQHMQQVQQQQQQQQDREMQPREQQGSSTLQFQHDLLFDMD
eukprot:m.14585 g.14585  ORF g.14585 m.14585 type:complete len:155 (-) comp7646_c0_seq1:189-653(-)